MNTHYAVIVFSGDPACEHPDEELNGAPPSLDLIACGPEDYCWEHVAKWTDAHPLRMWEQVEVLVRQSTGANIPEPGSLQKLPPTIWSVDR